MPRKNYTPAERALHLIGALAGKSEWEINEAIGKGDVSKGVPFKCTKLIPKGSLDMLKQRYAPHFADRLGEPPPPESWEVLWDHCVSPKKVSDL